MTKPRETALIADANQARVNVLREILEIRFGLDVISHPVFDGLKTELSKLHSPVIFIARDLPYEIDGATVITAKHFDAIYDEALKQADEITIFCLTTPENSAKLDLQFMPQYLYVPFPSPDSSQLQNLVAEIQRLGGLKQISKLKKPKWNNDELSLIRQIRFLSPQLDGGEGEEVLTTLIRDSLACDRATLHPIGQGKSGAIVFLLHAEADNHSIGEFILKLHKITNAQDDEKLRQEIQGHRRATDYLRSKGYSRHYPELEPPLNPSSWKEDDELRFVAKEKGWSATRYEFIGGKKLDAVFDLETALIASKVDLGRKLHHTPLATTLDKISKTRLDIFEQTLGWLRDHWYKHADFVNRREEKLWSFEDAVNSKYAPKPPYRLSLNTKAEIFNFLESPGADLGSEFFESWNTLRNKVAAFIEARDRQSIPRGLRRKLSVIISPSHGDLNTKNILLWTENELHPFLIDFPFFQEQGHALQDLAQLEADVIFALMDRQEGSNRHNLRAKDYTYSQMNLWKELVGDLLHEDIPSPKRIWEQKGYTENVQLCYDLIRKLREIAADIQKQNFGKKQPPPFAQEYFPALLYYSARSISYSSLSPFKRLLAVFSTGLVLDKLTK